MLHDKDGRVVKVYPEGSEEQLRWQLVLEYLIAADRKYLHELLQKKEQQRQEVKQILAGPDRAIVERRQRRRLQRYNLTQAAKILQMTRQGLYYWMKKGWVKARRDHRGYPGGRGVPVRAGLSSAEQVSMARPVTPPVFQKLTRPYRWNSLRLGWS